MNKNDFYDIAYSSEYASDLGKNTLTCPDCNSMAKTLIYSTTTLMYIPQSYDEEGNPLYPSSRNKIVNHYVCDNCGRNYSHEE